MIFGGKFLSLFLLDLKVTCTWVYVFFSVSDQIKYFKVFWSIIFSVAIDVMHDFIIA